MYRVQIVGIGKIEPAVEFTEYRNAVRYAELLMARHCPGNHAACAQVTDGRGGTHWKLSCAEWALLTSKRRAEAGM